MSNRKTKKGEDWKVRVPTIKGYESYSQMYDKKAAMLNKHGGAMKLPKLSEAEWFEDYTKYRNEFKEQVASGNRKVIGNVNQYIVSDQAYFMSAKQAREIQKGLIASYEETEDAPEYDKEMKKLMKDTTITSLRTGKFDWKTVKGAVDWKSFLSAEYQDAKKRLGSADAAHDYIQDFFFGTSE